MGIEHIAFNGSQPQQNSDYLIGRDDEKTELFRACAHSAIVELTAPSGVGKSSFVTAGLIPMLTSERDAYVPKLSTWSSATALLDLEEPPTAGQAAEMLYRIWIGAEPRDYRKLSTILAELSEDRWMVVVLDQFEELLRYRPRVAEELLKLVGRTAVRTHTPHIIVARSEYRERLRPAEVPGSDPWAMALTELTRTEDLKAMIDRPAADARVHFEDKASTQFVEWWNGARTAADTAGGQAAIGLLHYQTLLWSFKQWAGDDRTIRDRRPASDKYDDVITHADVLRFRDAQTAERRRRTGVGSPGDASDALLLSEALFNYVHGQVAKLTLPMTLKVAGEPDRELRWRNGPRLLLARIAPAMSAAGYKQPQSLSSLVPHALGDELGSRSAAELARALRRSSDAKAMRATAEQSELQPAGIATQWEEDASVVAEMIDALHAALQAMSSQQDVNIFREFVQADPIYELVHDGMGPALNEWAESFLDEPIATIGVVAPQPGRVIAAEVAGKDFANLSSADLELWGAEYDDEHDQVVLSAIRWPTGVIGRFESVYKAEGPLKFSGVCFRACDFTGAAFLNCEFENVRFEAGTDFTGAAFTNCRLRNVTFENCTLRATAMIGCVLDDVAFRAAPGGAQDLDLLTVIAPAPGADVTFAGVPRVTGLFLRALRAGTWTFEDVRAQHLVIDAAEVARFRFVRSTAIAMSVSGSIDEVLEDSRLVKVDLDQ